MKNKVIELSLKLKDVHKRFLDNERQQAEKFFERKIAPFEFLLMLTQDLNYVWIRPFSALIAEIDAFADESMDITKTDLACIKDQVDFLLKSAESSLSSRYQHHLGTDPDFIMLHASLKSVLNEFDK
jgi:hypothetical protein